MVKITAIWHDPELAHPFCNLIVRPLFLCQKDNGTPGCSDCCYAMNIIFAVCVWPYNNNHHKINLIMKVERKKR